MISPSGTNIKVPQGVKQLCEKIFVANGLSKDFDTSSLDKFFKIIRMRYN